MAELDILRGWKEIEDFLRMGRKAILRARYPVRCEQSAAVKRPSVYAFRGGAAETSEAGHPSELTRLPGAVPSPAGYSPGFLFPGL